MCGEHRSIVGIGVACQGSSPHVRGALNHSQDCKNRHGIIPACAGSTATKPWCKCLDRDHPRMCGEHPLGECIAYAPQGSSPHVRGAHNLTVDSVQNIGIIPACAGSTMVTAAAHPRCRDHPRMCGEHDRGQRVARFSAGSSPHVRGAHYCVT